MTELPVAAEDQEEQILKEILKWPKEKLTIFPPVSPPRPYPPPPSPSLFLHYAGQFLLSAQFSSLSHLLWFREGFTALRTDGHVTTALHVDVTCELGIYFKKTLRKLSSIGLQKQTHT